MIMEKINANIINKDLIGEEVSCFLIHQDNCVYNNNKYTFIPGFFDVHVHFREPGFSYKETIKEGSLAAAHGGYSLVASMPNLNPVSDTVEHIKMQQDIIDKDAYIKVLPYGSISINQKGEELSPLEDTAKLVFAFSDDGKGVQNENLMKEAMLLAKKLNKVIVAHCEVNSLLKGGYIHDGEYAKKHHHLGICSASEYEQIARDIKLAKLTGCKYHVCHISTKESVELIRQAKADGVDITCETAPHYLLLNESDLQESGDFKMNPPIRSIEDQQALIEGIKDGTIDMIATDHAPHSKEEKSKGLKDSPFGISGIDIAFPLLYTYLVKKNIISMDKLIELLVINPRKRFSIPFDGSFSIWDLSKEYKIDESCFLSKGKSSPFKGYKVYGENLLTVINQKIAYKK